MRLSIRGYSIEREVAVGELAQVFRARHEDSGDPVAIKLLHARLFPDEAVREVFLQEMARLIPLEHPNLVQTRETGVTAHGRVFVVQSFVDGPSTAERLNRSGPFAEADALRRAAEAAAGLGHAWATGRLVHGHLHPDNVMEEASGRTLVADLGLSRIVARLAGSGAVRGAVRGTRAYLAPEARGGLAALDVRSDIFALGLVLYHWTTGQVPFDGVPEDELRADAPPPPLADPREAQPELSVRFVHLLAALTAWDPAERYAGWDEVRADLAAVRADGRPARPADLPGPIARGLAAAPPAAELRPVPDSREARRPVRRRVPAAAPGSNGNGANAARARIVLSREEQRRLRRGGRRRTARPGAVLTAVLLVFAAAGYALWRFDVLPIEELLSSRPEAQPLPFEPLELPSADPPAAPPGVPDAPDAPAARPTPPRAPSPAPAPRPDSRTPTHPRYRSGAARFNEALALYQRYREDRRDPALLLRIEELAAAAIEDFEAYRADVPDDPETAGHIDRCYGMIRYARQSRLMDHGLDGGRRPGTDPGRRRAPPRDPPTRRFVPRPDLRLGPGWSATPAAGPAVRDLRVLLSGRGNARVRLEADDSILVLPGIPYLLPLERAAERLDRPPPEGRPLEHPAFPANTIRAHLLPGVAAGGADLVLFTDRAGQVVAARVAEEGALEPRLPAVLFSERWQLYDPGMGLLRPEGDLLVAHRVRSGESGLVQIESELAQRDPEQSNDVGRVLARATLVLPQPIVDLMLVRLAVAP